MKLLVDVGSGKEHHDKREGRHEYRAGVPLPEVERGSVNERQGGLGKTQETQPFADELHQSVEALEDGVAEKNQRRELQIFRHAVDSYPQWGIKQESNINATFRGS